ncbi:hypothetical protein LS684_04735 [Cytobacillus spongiae]|uniref:hypothetical protein n=1 Tax=Cytobacillus spongiae TaxID=2901381 RepID=UPI001F176BE8|nr:hypothetical protein [Cytobacillus spongiae]UII56777.1 hypothetical protein LS684_04735 [Cytobacillus spongiae]
MDLIVELSNFSSIYTFYGSLLLGVLLVSFFPLSTRNQLTSTCFTMEGSHQTNVKLVLNAHLYINHTIRWIHKTIKKYQYTDPDIEGPYLLLISS